VSLPEPKANFRKQLNIPDNAIVIGRHGGYDEFDLQFVHAAIYKALQTRLDIVFLFMNTRPFGPAHPNIIYVNGTHDLQNKSNFISTCDYMLHARNHGESFGLAICEFLHQGKPIISWKNGLDKHHIFLLEKQGVWYDDFVQLNNILLNLTLPNKELIEQNKNLVKQFSPKNVMEKFEKTFLN
jgi:hypothetical protein